MFKKLLYLGIGLALFDGYAVAHSNSKASPNESATKAEVPAVLYPLPSFQLTNQDGQNVSLATLQGKVWVANFIFTACGDECPLMTHKIKTLQSTLQNQKNIAFISITTDPKNDTPATLKKYAAKHKADSSNWSFLTGEKQKIVDLAVKGFKLAASVDSVSHSDKFVLIDAAGKIRGYYDWTQRSSLANLEQHMRSLARAEPKTHH